MNIGEKIKQLRTDKNFTQPQLAAAIGIEQSYLSKLENDKSIPSADIYEAILKAFSIDTAGFLAGIDDKIVYRQLRQIPAVANHLNAYAAYKVQNIKKWLFGSAAACVLGLTLIAAGYRGMIFSDKRYSYYSPGVLRNGESTDIYNRSDTMLARASEQYLALSDYRGQGFILPVAGGSRLFTLRSEDKHERPENRYLMLLGTALAFAGIFGFFVEYRLRHIKPSA